MSDAAERGDRLGVTMRMLGLVREPAPAAVEGASAAGLLTEEEWEVWREGDDQDIALAHACLTAEFELRERQWSALEAFGAAVAAGDGLGAVSAAVDLGWHHRHAEGAA